MANAAAPEFLNGLAEDEAVAVLALGVRTQLAPGTVLFKLGDAAHSLGDAMHHAESAIEECGCGD